MWRDLCYCRLDWGGGRRRLAESDAAILVSMAWGPPTLAWHSVTDSATFSSVPHYLFSCSFPLSVCPFVAFACPGGCVHDPGHHQQGGVLLHDRVGARFARLDVCAADAEPRVRLNPTGTQWDFEALMRTWGRGGVWRVRPPVLQHAGVAV